MRKKDLATSKDRKDWVTFTKHLENLYDKDADSTKPKTTVNKITKLDLHGLSLEDANKKVKKFIIKSFLSLDVTVYFFFTIYLMFQSDTKWDFGSTYFLKNAKCH